MIEIKPVKTKRELKAFATFAARNLYRDCKLYVPSLYADELSVIDPKKNFSLAHCDVKCFLAYRDGKVVGRIAGIINRKYNEIASRKCIRFSRFDCVDDSEVARKLLSAVEQFGREQGMDTMHGPWGFNDQDREGMLTEGFERRATYVTNYNYSYYEKLVKENGFSDEAEWVEYDFTVPGEVDPRIARIAERIREKLGVTDVAETMSRKEMVRKYGYEAIQVTNAAYAQLDCYVPVEGKEVENIFQQFVTVINPRYFSLLVNRKNEVVGMAVMLPSIAEALIRSRGRMTLPGIIRILRSIARPKELEMALIAVRPDYQKLGVNSIMIARIMKNIIEDGLKKIESNPELISNTAVQSQWTNLERKIIKRRKTFIKNI